MLHHRILLVVMAIWGGGTMIAQDQVAIGKDRMMLFGIVSEGTGGDALQNVTVRVFTDSVAQDPVFTDAMGKYQLFVPLTGVHRVVYSLAGHHRKVVEVDTNGEMDAEARAQEWNLRVDVSLKPAEIQLADDLLDTPVGKAAWQPVLREFQWDRPYTDRYEHRYKLAVKAAKGR